MARSRGSVSVAQLIYEYIVEGRSTTEISRDYGLDSGELTNLLSPYRILGSENRSGRGWGSGSNRGKYSRRGYIIQDGEKAGEEVDITYDVIEDYVRHRNPGQTLEDFIENGPKRVQIKSPGRIVAAAAVCLVCSEAMGVTSFFEIGSSSKYTASAEKSSFWDDFLDEGKGIATDKAKDAAKSTAKNALAKALSKSDATSKKAGTYEYKDYSVVGRKQLGKPYKTCILLGAYGTGFTIGEHSGTELNGYGINMRGICRGIGEWKKGELNGICAGYKTEYRVGKYKNGTLSGYGAEYFNGKWTVCKYSKGGYKVIGYVRGSTWTKENGKEWKVKDNTYKGMTIKGNTITIDDTMITIDGSSITYKNDDVNIKADGNSAQYVAYEKGNVVDDVRYDGSYVNATYKEGNVTQTLKGEYGYE